MPVGAQRLGGKRPLCELDRPLELTENGELTPEVELRLAVVRRKVHRTPILSLRAAPVKISY
jgi:hypothetical protein